MKTEEPFLTKGLIRLALIDLDKRDKTDHAKSYIVDTTPKCAEYILKRMVVLHFSSNAV